MTRGPSTPQSVSPSTPPTPSADVPYIPTSVGQASFRVLGSVERRLDGDDLEDLKRRVSSSLNLFPELDGRVVTVGWLSESEDAFARADWRNDQILLPTHERCPTMTICHELAHLAIHIHKQRGGDVPVTSEEFCSIFAVARLREPMIDTDRIAYLGEPGVQKAEWPRICRRALAYRQHSRNYIQQCSEWLEV